MLSTFVSSKDCARAGLHRPYGRRPSREALVLIAAAACAIACTSDAPPDTGNLAATSASGGTGAAGSSVTDHGACEFDGDCGEIQICVSGQCLISRACNSSRDCESPLVCNDGGLCVECVSDAECGGTQACAGYRCRMTCTSDRECLPIGLLCDHKLTICVDCIDDNDCGSGKLCVNSACAPAPSIRETGGQGGTAGNPATQAGGSPTDGGGSGAAAGSAGSILSGGEAGGGTAGHAGALASAGSMEGGNGGWSQGGIAGDTHGSGGASSAGGNSFAGSEGVISGHGECGNGFVEFPESCDDGNRTDSDGCSTDCEVEAEFECVQAHPGRSLALPIVYRDFRADHPDFEPGTGAGNSLATGMIAERLDDEGKPTYVGAGLGAVDSVESFAQWYRDDSSGVSSRIDDFLTLFDDGQGSLVVRWGHNGEPYVHYNTVTWCGDTANVTAPCGECGMSEFADCLSPCTLWGPDSVDDCGVADPIISDGSPLFFPIDGHPDAITPAAEMSVAVIPPTYGGNWEAEPTGALHNFHFTSELRFWFRFDAAQAYQIFFEGDDDAWVFVNQRLAIDVGGLHEPEIGNVTLSRTNAASYGLSDGGLYEVAVFHAERQTQSSSYLLRLTNFDLGPSVCTPM